MLSCPHDPSPVPDQQLTTIGTRLADRRLICRELFHSYEVVACATPRCAAVFWCPKFHLTHPLLLGQETAVKEDELSALGSVISHPGDVREGIRRCTRCDREFAGADGAVACGQTCGGVPYLVDRGIEAVLTVGERKDLASRLLTYSWSHSSHSRSLAQPTSAVPSVHRVSFGGPPRARGRLPAPGTRSGPRPPGAGRGRGSK